LVEQRKYKIGEIARLAGVSRRTIDYYTNLGLLKPVRSESNYRYYSGETLVRLKLIEGMKKKRLTLEEIGERLNLLEYGPVDGVEERRSGAVNIDFLLEQIRQFENQLARLQPVAAGPEANKGVLPTRQALVQSIALLHSLMQYISEMAPDLTTLL